jgi:biotin synthase
LIDYAQVRVEQMRFDAAGRVVHFGLPNGQLDAIIDKGIAFRTSGCPGKIQEDISACDRPYGDSPPSNIASYPFQPAAADLRRIRHQLDREKAGEPYRDGEELEIEERS